MSDNDTLRLTMTLRVECDYEALAEERFSHEVTISNPGGTPSAAAVKALAEAWLEASRPGAPPAVDLPPEAAPAAEVEAPGPVPAQPEQSEQVGAVIAGLMGGGSGEEVSEGHFTLAREAAQEKLEVFQLEDPHRYVLLLIQGAVRRRATEIRFDIDADDMRMHFDGPAFSGEELATLLEAFVNQADPAKQVFSLGLSGARALEPRFIRLRSGDGERAAVYEIGKSGGPQEATEEASNLVGTEIHVKSRLRLGRIVGNLAKSLPEERHLKSECVYAHIPIERGSGAPSSSTARRRCLSVSLKGLGCRRTGVTSVGSVCTATVGICRWMPSPSSLTHPSRWRGRRKIGRWDFTTASC